MNLSFLFVCLFVLRKIERNTAQHKIKKKKIGKIHTRQKHKCQKGKKNTSKMCFYFFVFFFLNEEIRVGHASYTETKDKYHHHL
jgi:hypothetical protein